MRASSGVWSRRGSSRRLGAQQRLRGARPAVAERGAGRSGGGGGEGAILLANLFQRDKPSSQQKTLQASGHHKTPYTRQDFQHFRVRQQIRELWNSYPRLAYMPEVGTEQGMAMSLQGLYAFRDTDSWLAEAPTSWHRTIPEKLVRCLWFDPRWRPPALRTLDGQEVVVHSPGRWNLQAGPDFQHAVITFTGTSGVALPGRRRGTPLCFWLERPQAPSRRTL